MTDKTDFYTKIRRSMFRRINDVGAKPFLLFQYYLTYATAPKINPSLKTVALDMGILDKRGEPQVSAVSHLKKELINAGWIREENDEIVITFDPEKTEKVEKISSRKLRKSQQQLRKSQVGVEKISINVEKISTNSLDFLNSPYIRIENEQEKYQKEQREEEEHAPDGAAHPQTNEREKTEARVAAPPRVEIPPQTARLPRQAKTRAPTPTFETIVADLSAEPAYVGIDVSRESRKALGWLKNNPGRKFTRSFFVRWLNRIDAPVAVPENIEILIAGEKQNGQFKTAREKQNATIIDNYNFIEQFRAFAEQQKSALHGEAHGNHRLLA